AAQVDEESFVWFGEAVADYLDGDGLAGLTRREGQGAGGRLVVGAGRGAAVGGGVLDGHRLVRPVLQSHGEAGLDRARVAFGDARVADRQLRAVRPDAVVEQHPEPVRAVRVVRGPASDDDVNSAAVDVTRPDPRRISEAAERIARHHVEGPV